MGRVLPSQEVYNVIVYWSQLGLLSHLSRILIRCCSTTPALLIGQCSVHAMELHNEIAIVIVNSLSRITIVMAS